MPIKFTPKTEKEIAEEFLLSAGVYPFEVLTAEEAKSKKGNDMIAISIRVFYNDGGSQEIKDWLMEKMLRKLIHFCRHTGLEDKYNSGTLAASDCQGKSGFVELEIQTDKFGQYPDKNAVKDYVAKPAGVATAPKPDAKTDDVPF